MFDCLDFEKKIKENLTTVNYESKRADIRYIVIHYTGNKGDTAVANSTYFKSINRGASAHYFVDSFDTYRVVPDKYTAWHCGDDGKGVYKYVCNNYNSIGIEMCSSFADGKYFILNKTVDNTLILVRYLMYMYAIPVSNVIRHYDVTSKNCPTPFVIDTALWHDFKSRLNRIDGYYNCPWQYQGALYDLMDKGIIKGTGKSLDLSVDMLRGLMFSERLYNAGK